MFVSSQRSDLKTVEGKNFLVIFEGAKNISEDEPLLILANYDTDESETNPVDDNGSGLVALVSLAGHISHQITSGKLILDRTLIFAATDAALTKYEFGLPEGSTTGAEALVRRWLPSFMQGRRKFGGAIVLDSIMNYNDQPRTQVDREVSKAFPSAYREMSYREFRGDFLAIVHRDDELDSPLVKTFERAWRYTKEAPREEDHEEEVKIDPALIRFTYTNTTFSSVSATAIHFLRSEQGPFWNHFVPQIRSRKLPTKELPALLLTDTGEYIK